MTRRRIAAGTAVLLCAGVTWAPAAPAAPTRRLYVITSTRPGPTPLVVDLVAQAAGDEGFAMVFAVMGTVGRRLVTEVFAREFGDQTSARLVGGGTATDSCAANLAVCSTGQTPGAFTFRSGEASRIAPGFAVYLAVEAASVTLRLGPHLRARVVDGAFRRVTSEVADDAAVGVGRVHAARFTEASMPGGSRGSVAVAAIPCEIEGEGRATLAGDGTKALSCGSAQSAVVSGVVPGRVTWRLTGGTTGLSATRTRLATVDLS